MEEKEEMEASQERAEKVRKRREVDDKGGKMLMDKAMKKARLGASDDEEGETPKSQGRGRTSAASHIAAAKQRAAELHLERTERRLEVQREIELERLRSQERIEAIRAQENTRAEQVRAEAQAALVSSLLQIFSKKE